MPTVHRSVLLPYSDQQMFDLVSDVPKYPEFMPWCGGSEVLETHEDGVTASVHIRIAGVSQTFTTRNTYEVPRQMVMKLVNGPFSRLEGVWRFTALDESACKVELDLEYDFSSRMLAAVVGPVFSKIANTFIDSFVKRAQAVYGDAF